MKLTLRTVMLLALLSAQRCQTIYKLSVEDIELKADSCSCTIVYNSVAKQTVPGKIDSWCKPLVLTAFENKKLCIVDHLRQYLIRTAGLRHDSCLFIGTTRPHRHVSKDTIAWWIKTVLQLANIDITKYTAYSIRSASTSAAAERDVPLTSILRAAGWARSSTFGRFYYNALLVINLVRSVRLCLKRC